MESKRKIEIFVRTTRRFVVRQPPESDELINCPVCGDALLAADRAAAILQINCRRLYRLVEAGATHFLETDAGALLVCLPSLNSAIGETSDAPPAEIVNLLADATAENQTEEIKLKRELL